MWGLTEQEEKTVLRNLRPFEDEKLSEAKRHCEDAVSFLILFLPLSQKPTTLKQKNSISITIPHNNLAFIMTSLP